MMALFATRLNTSKSYRPRSKICIPLPRVTIPTKTQNSLLSGYRYRRRKVNRSKSTLLIIQKLMLPAEFATNTHVDSGEDADDSDEWSDMSEPLSPGAAAELEKKGEHLGARKEERGKVYEPPQHSELTALLQERPDPNLPWASVADAKYKRFKVDVSDLRVMDTADSSKIDGSKQVTKGGKKALQANKARKSKKSRSTQAQ